MLWVFVHRSKQMILLYICDSCSLMTILFPIRICVTIFYAQFGRLSDDAFVPLSAVVNRQYILINSSQFQTYLISHFLNLCWSGIPKSLFSVNGWKVTNQS